MATVDLAQALAAAPADQLLRMARAHGLPAGADRGELMARLLRLLSDSSQVARCLDQLTPEEWQALKVVYWGSVGGGITVELCHELAGSLDGRRRPSSARALGRLLDRGLIAVGKVGYRQVYLIPAELRPFLTAALREELIRQLAVAAPPPDGTDDEAAPAGAAAGAAAGAEESAGSPPAPAAALADPAADMPDLVEELVRLLAYLRRSPVPLTHQGAIHRRHLQALRVQLGLGPAAGEAPENAGPEPLGLLIDFALAEGLAERQGGSLRPGPGLDPWLRLPEDRMRAALYRFWAGRHPSPDLQAFLHLVRVVGPRWIRVTAAAEELAAVVRPGQRPGLLPRLSHHLQQFLAPLRLLALAHTPAGEPVCRLTPVGERILAPGPERPPEPAPEGRPVTGEDPGEPRQPRATDTRPGPGGLPAAPEGPWPVPTAPGAPPAPDPSEAGRYRFILQPCGELIAPRPVPVPVLWRLEGAADLVRRGPALVYRLSRESVYRALRAGETGAGLIGFLTEYSATGLPQNLAFDLEAWSQAYGQVYFQQLCLLRCADPVLATRIRASRRTGPYIRGALTPCDLIVDPRDCPALDQALQAEGLLPRPGILSGPGEPEPGGTEPPSG